MAKEYALPFYHSKAWLDCRDGYIKSVNGLCERCLAKGQYTPGKVVHHKTYITPQNVNEPEITLSWDNLEYLCQMHHNEEHHVNEVTASGVRFDSFGNLISVNE